MIITKLEPFDRREKEFKKSVKRNAKVRVYIDDCYAFPFYISELKGYGLEEGSELTDSAYEALQDIVLQHAKQKALSLLKFMDRTESELRNRLSEDGIPKEVIQSTIEYVLHYGYLNDERYTVNYIRQRKETKSKRIIKAELTGKGINSELIEMLFAAEYQEQEEDPEITAIKKAISKKGKEPNSLSREEKQKLMAQLYRKGFELDKIKKLIDY